jgi:VanZ family protein
MIGWLEKNRGISILLTALIAIEIFAFSSIPGGISGTGGIIRISIIYHLTVFFLFNFFLLMSIKGNREIKISYIIIALIISMLYAFLDEFHQFFVPFREPAISDVLTDTAGIFLATILTLYFNKKK